VEEWFEFIRPDFIEANAFTIAGIYKLIAAKAALKGRKGAFGKLVEALGEDQDKVERLFVIAKHPVLSNSAHARILPTSWMTQYTLAKIKPEVLTRLIEEGKVHPHLQRKEAERLVEQTRRRNSTNGGEAETAVDGHREPLTFTKILSLSDDDDDDDDRDNGHGDVHRDEGHDVSRDEGHDVSRDEGRDVGRDEGHAEGHGEDCAEGPGEDHGEDRGDIGSSSQGELDRKLARLEELERQVRQWEIQRTGWESEVAELKAKLDETPVRHQRRLFRNVLEAMQKAETSTLPTKEKRSLHNSAIIDLTELVRSLARDGVALERVDLFCRPELH
jgi:hypothetical protein